jgi:GntR family transcriptional regulator
MAEVEEVSPIPAPAHVATKHRLKDLARRLAERGENRLPPEEELARLLGVSRSTVRSALLSLQKEGMLSRVRGRGTHVHLAALGLAANLSEEKAYLTLLADLGLEPSTAVLGAARIPAPGLVAGRLRLGPQAEVLRIERVFHGDGRPLIYSTDFVPMALLRAPLEGVSFETSTFRFAARWCGVAVSYSIADIVPTLADERTAEVLGCAPGRPVLRLEHTHLDAADEPVVATVACFHEDVRFSVVRTGVET